MRKDSSLEYGDGYRLGGGMQWMILQLRGRVAPFRWHITFRLPPFLDGVFSASLRCLVFCFLLFRCGFCEISSVSLVSGFMRYGSGILLLDRWIASARGDLFPT